MLTIHELATVIGGACGEYTELSGFGMSVSQCVSDQALCVQTAADMAQQQYPDTRRWLGPIANPFETDANAAKRATQTAANVATMCPNPNRGGGGGGAGFS